MHKATRAKYISIFFYNPGIAFNLQKNSIKIYKKKSSHVVTNGPQPTRGYQKEIDALIRKKIGKLSTGNHI